MNGEKNRLDRILNPDTHRVVIVAIDHGMMMGGLPGIRDIKETIKVIVKEEPEGVLMGYGIAKKFHTLFSEKRSPSIILRADYITSMIPIKPPEVERYGLVANVQEALRLGADAIMLFLVLGLKNSEALMRNIEAIASTSEECEKSGLPLYVEPTLWGENIPKEKKNKIEFIRDACRIAVELGADIIKAPYTGNSKTFAEVIKSCPVPVTIWGGPKMKTSRDVLETGKEAIAAGAIGVVFGRNIWQHPKPTNMIRAIKKIVHEDVGVDEALKEIE